MDNAKIALVSLNYFLWEFQCCCLLSYTQIRPHIRSCIIESTEKTHGSPEDELRMVGDLGNIVVTESGDSQVELTDSVITLLGPHSIIGRSIVIFAGEDDQGRGGHENSLQTGNAGPRIAAGVVGLA